MASSSSSSMDKPGILSMISRHNPLATPSILIDEYMDKNHITIDTIPSRYTGYFFRKDIIDNFCKDLITSLPPDKLPTHPLSKFKFYNKDDIMNNLTYDGSPGSRKVSTISEGLQHNLKSTLDSLQKVCSDNILETYTKEAFDNTFTIPENITESKFDILVLSKNIIEDVTKDFNARISGVVAFIIVELGECQQFPKAFSINLICANEPGTGSLLMSVYLYTILSHPIDTSPNINPLELTSMGINGLGFKKVVNMISSDGSNISSVIFITAEPLIPIQDVAVLELATSYGNVGGLCMYEKFGFKYDPTMFSDDCFKNRNNLPMKIDFTNNYKFGPLSIEQKKQLVINITTEISKNEFTKSPICNLRGPRQNLLGYLKSFYVFNNTAEAGTLFKINNGDINAELRKLKPKDPDILPKLIHYLETVGISTLVDPNMEKIINKLLTKLPELTPPAATPAPASAISTDVRRTRRSSMLSSSSSSDPELSSSNPGKLLSSSDPELSSSNPGKLLSSSDPGISPVVEMTSNKQRTRQTPVVEMPTNEQQTRKRQSSGPIKQSTQKRKTRQTMRLETKSNKWD